MIGIAILLVALGFLGTYVIQRSEARKRDLAAKAREAWLEAEKAKPRVLIAFKLHSGKIYHTTPVEPESIDIPGYCRYYTSKKGAERLLGDYANLGYTSDKGIFYPITAIESVWLEEYVPAKAG